MVKMIRTIFRFCRLGLNRHVMTLILMTIVSIIYMKRRGYFFRSIQYVNCENLVLKEFSDEAKRYIYFGLEKQTRALNVTEIRRWILYQNARENILNLDLYGPITLDTMIIVVQVHKYSCEINYLLASLSEVEGIQDTLVIFSHSYVDHNLNSLIQSIDFCRILQIYYPYSIQAYPNEFPGYDKNDCPTNLNLRTAEILNCTGAMTPDIYGRYRDPMNAEKKHHWWWTANKVFTNLSHTIDHKGIVIFLEHNLYIYKKFIFIVYEMKNVAETLPQCDFLSFASSLDVKDENEHSFEFTLWDPKYHSNILGIDITAWSIIESHYDVFCLIDDCSWSRSLYEISINRSGGKMFKVLSSVAARALQITCTAIDVIDCHVVETIVEIFNFQKNYKDLMFPRYSEILHDIVLYDDELNSADYVASNGGWNDQRDKQLCSNMTINKANKYFVHKDKHHNSQAYMEL